MNPDWQMTLQKLAVYPSSAHRILAPCPEYRIEQAEDELGKMPMALTEMLNHFNGARLFLRSGPLLAIFGISTIPPLPPFQWASDWYIDKFTPSWRSFSEGKPTDWAIGMMNYGGLIILDPNGTVKEWDTGQKLWTAKTWDFAGWIDEILAEGDLYMQE